MLEENKLSVKFFDLADGEMPVALEGNLLDYISERSQVK